MFLCILEFEQLSVLLKCFNKEIKKNIQRELGAYHAYNKKKSLIGSRYLSLQSPKRKQLYNHTYSIFLICIMQRNMYLSDVCSNNHKTLYRSISQETRSKKKYDYWIFIDFIFLCALMRMFAFFCSLGETLFSKVFLIQGIRKSIRSFLRFAYYKIFLQQKWSNQQFISLHIVVVAMTILYSDFSVY